MFGSTTTPLHTTAHLRACLCAFTTILLFTVSDSFWFLQQFWVHLLAVLLYYHYTTTARCRLRIPPRRVRTYQFPPTASLQLPVRFTYLLWMPPHHHWTRFAPLPAACCLFCAIHTVPHHYFTPPPPLCLLSSYTCRFLPHRMPLPPHTVCLPRTLPVAAATGSHGVVLLPAFLLLPVCHRLLNTLILPYLRSAWTVPPCAVRCDTTAFCVPAAAHACRWDHFACACVLDTCHHHNVHSLSSAPHTLSRTHHHHAFPTFQCACVSCHLPVSSFAVFTYLLWLHTTLLLCSPHCACRVHAPFCRFNAHNGFCTHWFCVRLFLAGSACFSPPPHCVLRLFLSFAFSPYLPPPATHTTVMRATLPTTATAVAGYFGSSSTAMHTCFLHRYSPPHCTPLPPLITATHGSTTATMVLPVIPATVFVYLPPAYFCTIYYRHLPPTIPY